MLATALLLVTSAAIAETPDSHREVPKVEVDGDRLVDGQGRPVQLRGVNRSGMEYACVQGLGLSDGPVDGDAISAMADWEINAVRIPLNEDCWLGASGLEAESSGAAYRRAVVDYTERLGAAGFVVILDLHWTGIPGDIARQQQPMARRDRSPEFWRSVATEFRERQWVMFDVFNEPHDISWDCWRDGCGGYAGMQDLVDAIRSVGASQPIVLSGLDWGGDVRGWLEHRPFDPAGALVAGTHLYDFKRCVTDSCWEEEIGQVATEVPVVITEFGDTDCTGDFSARLMAWANGSGVSYLAWAWNPWDCEGGPALITSFDGSPTPFGEVIRGHFRSRRPPADLPARVPGGGDALPV